MFATYRKSPASRPSLLRKELGASSVEYGVLVACIAGVVVASITGLGQHVASIYDYAVNLIISLLA